MKAYQPGEAAVDKWSAVHLAAGWWLGTRKVTPVQALTGIVLYEVIEAFLRQSPTADGQGLTEYESAANIAADVEFGMLGFYLQRKRLLSRWRL